VIKAEEWPTLMGMKRLPLNWCFTLRIRGGGRGNGRGMQCGARDSGSMAGEAGAAQEVTQGRRRRCLLCSARGGRRKPAGPGGLKGQVG
jgi:hypothetical protein